MRTDFAYDPPSPHYGPQLGRRSSRRTPDMPPGVRLKLQSQPTTPAAIDSHRSRSRLSLNLGMTPASEHPPELVASPVADPDLEGSAHRAQHDRAFSFTHAHDSDLRDMVMDCISRSIGLIQPEQRSGANSLETSPAFGPVTGSTSSKLGQRATLRSSFGAFSLLHQDDGESITSTSSSAQIPLELENEVEILAFSRNTVLVHSGERNAGLFFVIDGHRAAFTTTVLTL